MSCARVWRAHGIPGSRGLLIMANLSENTIAHRETTNLQMHRDSTCDRVLQSTTERTMLFTAGVGQPGRSSMEVEGDRLAARTERLVSTRATLCVGYWAALYINRDGGWSVACDALGRIIRCETEKLALSVARYRRRRLQPLRGGSQNSINT
jgi:hypothetical protein